MKDTSSTKKTTLWLIIGLIIAGLFWFFFTEGVNDAREKDNVKVEKIIAE